MGLSMKRLGPTIEEEIITKLTILIMTSLPKLIEVNLITKRRTPGGMNGIAEMTLPPQLSTLDLMLVSAWVYALSWINS